MIDFSKAPEGATHYNPTNVQVTWWKIEGGLWHVYNLYGGAWFKAGWPPPNLSPIPKGHPHAALMAEYAKDAATMEEPWKLWEWCNGKDVWRKLSTNPSWITDIQYRRTPKQYTINVFLAVYEDGKVTKFDSERLAWESKPVHVHHVHKVVGGDSKTTG